MIYNDAYYIGWKADNKRTYFFRFFEKKKVFFGYLILWGR